MENYNLDDGINFDDFILMLLDEIFQELQDDERLL